MRDHDVDFDAEREERQKKDFMYLSGVTYMALGASLTCLILYLVDRYNAVKDFELLLAFGFYAFGIISICGVDIIRKRDEVPKTVRTKWGWIKPITQAIGGMFFAFLWLCAFSSQ